MARNFIIQFNGREGSSAIISALSAQKGVNVPLFEELDDYEFYTHHKAEDYPAALDAVFRDRAYNGTRIKAEYLAPQPPKDTVKTTGFKWRVNGPIPQVAAVLKAHNVTVFSLQRRDFLSYVCSLYVHTYGNQLQSGSAVPMHPHFDKTRGAAEGADPAQRSRLNQQKFSLDKGLFLRSAKEAVMIRQNQAGKSRHLARAGVPIEMMFYEDFDRDNEGFIIDTLAKIGHDISGHYTPFCEFEKVHKTPLSERIENLEKATKTWRYKHLQKEYFAAIKATEALIA